MRADGGLRIPGFVEPEVDLNCRHSTGEAATELKPHELRGQPLRRAMSTVTLAWFFGAIWLSATSGTPTTNYASALGASNFQFGVLAALPFVASFLAIPGTFLIEATGRRRLIFFISLFFQRLMWIPIALIPLWIYKTQGDSGKALAANAFLVLMFLMQCGHAFGGMGFIGWMSDLVPPGIRGAYFSRRRQWSLVSSIPAAWGAGWLLDHFALAGNAQVLLEWCSIVFLIAAFFGVLDIVIFLWVPDVATPPKKGDDLMRSWGEPLKNRNFLWFAGFAAAYVFAVAPMGQFTTLFILSQFATDGQATGSNQITQLMLIVAPAAAQLPFLGIWGKAADRMGKRPVLILSSLGLVPVAIVWCFVTPETIWLGYLVSAAGGILWAGVDIANFNIVLEFSGSAAKNGARGGTAYAGAHLVIVSIAGMLGGLAFGLLADWTKDVNWTLPAVGQFTFFHILFLVSAVLRLLAVVVFLPAMHEPEARPTVDALNYVTSNIYNNLLAAMMQPLRIVGIANDGNASGDER